MSDAILLWIRRDLRLSDHPAMRAAMDSGRPVIPVFILDETFEAYGAAPKFRLGLGLQAFAEKVEQTGGRLILRRGDALGVLRDLVAETGARELRWQRAYEPEAIARDTAVKAALKGDGLTVESHGGHVLFEPWTVENGQGGPYRVYSPFWRAVRDRDPGAPEAAVTKWHAPESWPASDTLEAWDLGAAMNRGAEVLARYTTPGEDVAQARLAAFIDESIGVYKDKRDVPAAGRTSGMSEHLTYGEISPRQIWAAGQRAMEEGEPGAETFLKELVWREFAYHLMYNTPRILTGNWRKEWDSFPWSTDERRAEVKAWKQGRTGVPFVDAAILEMYVTGRMHNRARMIVASYLTKNLMVHWKVGMDWFAEHLTDWDPASNAMGWQWVAGSGPDASPYFRIFNPETQAEKFDPNRDYRDMWLAEGRAEPARTALDFYDAIPRRWQMSPGDDYAMPKITLREGRERALAAYGAR